MNALNSLDGAPPAISRSTPLARHVDSMILKHDWSVGSWLHSSKRRLYDSSRCAVRDSAGENADVDEKEARVPVWFLNLLNSVMFEASRSLHH